jgi:hypothetical protein
VSAAPSTDVLRELIRDALRDLVPARAPTSAPVSAAAERTSIRFEGRGDPISVPTGEVDVVAFRNDADLGAFVNRLLHLFENPKSREDLRAGRIRFRLAESSVPGSAIPSRRIDSGAVTEATVKEAARSGATLVLGPNAVLTPLARDRARSAGVLIKREQS